MAVISVQVLKASTGEQSSRYLTKSITYRITCNSEGDGPDVITAHASVPVVDSSTYVFPFKYGNDSDNLNLVCRKISNLKRVANASNIWQLTADFIYDADTVPASKGLIVTPTYKTVRRPIDTAEFVNWYKPKTTGSVGADTFSNLEVDEDTEAIDDDIDTLDKGKIGPVTNSAGTPVIPGIEADFGETVLICEWTCETPTDYRPYLGASNDDEFTITDSHTDLEVIKDAGGFILISASQSPRWYYNQLLFDTRLEIIVREEGDYGDHYELDRGLAEYVEVGDSDGKGGTYGSSADLPPSGLRPLLGPDGQPLSQPIPFNGRGKAIELFQPSKARYLRWRTKAPIDFELLNIGVFT